MTVGLRASPFSSKADQNNLEKRPWGIKHIVALLNKIPIKKQSITNILDVGFGKTARSTIALSNTFPTANIVAIDNNYYALEEAYKKSTDKIQYVFGDPEIALPDNKFDLIMLCMVCHSFSNPLRALSNLINSKYTVKDNSTVLFIHRTDDFMRAISGLRPNDNQDLAATEIYKMWQDNQTVMIPYQYRFICEHEWLSYFMRMNGFNLIDNGSKRFDDVAEETVCQVLNEQRYSPLKDLLVDVNRYNDIKNKKVELSFYLYKKTSDPQVDTSVLARSYSSALFSTEVLSYSVNPFDEDHKDEFKKQAKDWFFKSYIYQSDETLKYGFYVDKRISEGRMQLWPETPLEIIPEGESITLIEALSKITCMKKNNWSLIWVLIPRMQCWYSEYKRMDDIVDKVDDEKTWYILPYMEPSVSDENVFIARLKQLETGDCRACLTAEDYKKLANFLTVMVKKLKEHGVVATYYMLFVDPYSPGKQKLSFSVHTTRWLNISEIHSLSNQAKSALAAINWNVTARTSAEAEILKKHSQMLDLLQKPLESLTDLLNKTQEDTQTLRAILYDPHRSIFAAAPRVMKYFEQDRDISFGSVNWKAPHEGQHGTPEELANTVAVIVCEIFGKAGLMPADTHELYDIANGLLNSEGKAFYELRELCKKIIEFKEIPINDNDKLTKAFWKLKTVLFTPYKDGEKEFPLLPLLVVLYDYSENSHLSYKAFNNKTILCMLTDSQAIGSNVFVGLKLPIPRYSALLAFLSGILAYAKRTQTSPLHLSAMVEDTSVKIHFASIVFNIPELKDTFKTMQKIIKHKLLHPLYVGNFQKPFFDFAGMCVKEGRSACLRPNIKAPDEIVIKYEDTSASIKLTECDITFSLNGST